MAIHKLDDLVQAITNAVVKAKLLSEKQHINSLRDYFVKNKDGRTKAKTVKLSVPSPSENGDAEIEIDVPLITLVPINSLLFSEIEIEFDAFLSSVEGCEHAHDDTKKSLQMELGGRGLLGQRKNNVKVKVCLKGTEPPEGLVKVNDQILKYLP